MKHFSNSEIAGLLSEIGEYLEMQGMPWKPRAYQKVAETVSALAEPVSEIFAKGGAKALEEIPGVGKGIAEKIAELFTTGDIAELEALRRKTPVDLSALRKVQGLGPKSIRTLYKKLGVKDVAGLERAARAGKIGALAGFGAKSEENILKNIGFAKKSSGRFLLSEGLAMGRTIEARLRAQKGVSRAIAAGSLRRRKETIGDIDLLVIARHPAEVMDFVAAMPEVRQVYGKGATKTSVRLSSGINLDVRVVPEESYGAALMYFTGSKDHNVALRSMAIRKGYKLNEYGLSLLGADRRGQERGLTRTGKTVAGKTEEEIYKKLGLAYIEPEMRENAGEIDAALRQAQGKPGGLPQLVGYGDLRGDLQVQTDWSDGAASIEAMAKAAAARGLEYIAITDHTKRLTIANGLDEKRIVKQWAEIDRVNKKLKSSGVRMRVLKGTECDILKDGSLDLPDDILAKLDVVGVSVHSYFNLPEKEQTERIVRAITNPHADILFHPTGRVIGRREPYAVDMERVIRAAKETGTALEINAFPDRADLKDEYVRQCVKAGVKMAIDSDAHAPAHFSVLECGIAQARRGWASRKDIVNTLSFEAMKKMLKK